ncbi:tripartite tricarboxylate transporter permease [Micromonospora sp. DR5-3]|uniref:tripartite tricarboxylate transporter permease n=1 Tax=unclassified Micromonospora TaxID=2617518 RepID=UPI0011D57E74|nr:MULTISPECIES: tripartite tricarboxylate transporter permease [unclassified Micromonospora]MCW3815896.1 tripartite tricarboxylate transporter permease [Micromonospora sp. DR5-3]TYC24406.1 tripartite tricarboxylate transporter permease [Micromonospora sp. MP36]
MDGISELLAGFAVALTLANLGYALIGTIVGTMIGVLPGIGPALTIALLLPLTYGLEPSGAFIMFAGIYYGAMYGGSTTSILLKTPGESGSIITAIDGNKMARAGRGAAALATAAIGSFLAGTIATGLLAVAAPRIVDLAVRLGAPDYLALMVLAFMCVGSLLGGSMLRGFASLGLGLAIGLVGIDFQSGQARLDFGLVRLLDGIDTVLLIVGLFAIGEVLYVAAHQQASTFGIASVAGQRWMTREDWRRSWKPWLRGTAIGFPLGTIPAGGSEVPTFLSYSLERRLSRRPEEFGNGAIEGVAGPEAANNANAAGALVPLLTLGIPTSATAAVILVAFQQYGIQPGPQLLDTEPALVWGLIASLFIGNAILLVLNLPLVGLWVKMLHIPKPYLYAGIGLFALVGAYAVNGSSFDVYLLLVVGVLGYFMRRFGFPIAPLIVGAILGPLAELQLRRALDIAGGDLTTLVSTPFTVAVYSLLVLVLCVPALLRLRTRRAQQAAGVPTPDRESSTV